MPRAALLVAADGDPDRHWRRGRPRARQLCRQSRRPRRPVDRRHDQAGDWQLHRSLALPRRCGRVRRRHRAPVRLCGACACESIQHRSPDRRMSQNQVRRHAQELVCALLRPSRLACPSFRVRRQSHPASVRPSRQRERCLRPPTGRSHRRRHRWSRAAP